MWLAFTRQPCSLKNMEQSRRRTPARLPSRLITERGFSMWFDDASLLSLEEVDWKVGVERNEMNATIRDEDFLESTRFDDTWRGAQEICANCT